MKTEELLGTSALGIFAVAILLLTGTLLYREYREDQKEKAKAEFAVALDRIISSAPGSEAQRRLGERIRSILADPQKLTEKSVDELRSVGQEAKKLANQLRSALREAESAKEEIARRRKVASPDEVVTFFQAGRMGELSRRAVAFDQMAHQIDESLIPMVEEAIASAKQQSEKPQERGRSVKR
ncbi:hypothetical protein [Candidatus Methylacidithermus pantelleriae]|uniref:Uncharacterized protein n=1 Tax=Candidatus Methylacidithermus pantelleriae TaxID=2744239 RepID=A0A8J2BPJ6_9BACT|nr:hypothetical protein [Candidatus Methylacidithermus pantelleriae]CAF0701149.1 hypothetical protein MPNT_40165 [Candidatus Methylacidithermus pantelleriae]